MAAVADISQLEDGVFVQLLLNIHQPLDHIRSPTIGVVGQSKSRSLAGSGPVGADPSLILERIAEIGVGLLRIGGELRPPADIAGEIETGFGVVLHVIHPEAGPYRPTFR